MSIGVEAAAARCLERIVCVWRGSRALGAALTTPTGVCMCRRAFYDKRVSQEVNGEALGEVRRRRRRRSLPPLALLHAFVLLSIVP